MVFQQQQTFLASTRRGFPVQFFRQTSCRSSLHQVSLISQRLQIYSLPLAVCLVCPTWAMDFPRTVDCQALVLACLRYRRVFHSPVVLGQVCLRYLPAYLSLAEYLLFQVFLTLLLGYLASDLVYQRFQALDLVYLRCQRDFLLAVSLDFPMAVFLCL
jgi:hypothetical protein